MSLPVGRVYAEQLRHRLGLEPQTEMALVAQRLRLPIEEVEAKGFEGALVRPVGAAMGIIAISKDIRERGRRNFTIAHEIGHFVLPGHERSDNVCLSNHIESFSKDTDRYEREANEFAGEFLIPSAFASKKIVARPPGLSVIREIAQESDASLTASGWRFCELTPERCAMVRSKEKRIAWYKSSEDFGVHVRVGDDIESGTVAFDCFAQRQVPSEPVPVSASLWLASRNLLPGAQIWEESVFLPYYGSVLTLLWVKDRIEQHTEWDEEQEEPLDPQEFTLRRKRWPRK